MKNRLLPFIILLFSVNLSTAQEWMTDLKIAQKLALVQNKMVLMVWEGTTEYPYPVYVEDERGRRIFIRNLFLDENVSPLIWEHFVPVIVSENNYGVMYAEIKGKRSQTYIEKFNDNSIKIMDVNGNILNATDVFLEDFQNISDIIRKYAINTAFISPELNEYKSDKNFYSSFFLASKYTDFSLYASTKLRPKILALSRLYIDESKRLAKSESKESKEVLLQRCKLLEINQFLILKRPKRVLRELKKLDAEKIENPNSELVAFLFYTAYMSTDKAEEAKLWKSKISSLNLKKAEKIINLNS